MNWKNTVGLLFAVWLTLCHAGASLIFSEVMYEPNSDVQSWQWVEIYNTGTTEIDLTGWVFDNDDGNKKKSAGVISSGSLGAGEIAILYNSDALSAGDFSDAWGTGLNLIAVPEWNRGRLSKKGDKISLWESYADYETDHRNHTNAVATLEYGDANPWPTSNGASSIYLTDLNADPANGANWALSSAGTDNAYQSSPTSTGGTGQDVGSPGLGPSISVIPEPSHAAILLAGGIFAIFSRRPIRRRSS